MQKKLTSKEKIKSVLTLLNGILELNFTEEEAREDFGCEVNEIVKFYGCRYNKFSKEISGFGDFSCPVNFLYFKLFVDKCSPVKVLNFCFGWTFEEKFEGKFKENFNKKKPQFDEYFKELLIMNGFKEA